MPLEATLLFINIHQRFFDFAILFFLGLVVFLLVFMLIFLYVKAKRNRKIQKWKLMADLLARKAIFYEDEDDASPGLIGVTSRLNKLIINRHFRKVLTDELVNAKKNVTGTSAENLKRLYLQLTLDQFALARLKNYNWYIKAQAIQELSIMDIKDALTKIYRFTNNANDLLRAEAQVAVIKFYGFEGLRFLDVISYPITEWQQIKLLHELTRVSPTDFSGIEKWLSSKNKTVVSFALKLVRNYHRFELHDIVADRLGDEDAGVRMQAIFTLGEIFSYNTSEILISRLPSEDNRHKTAIIRVLRNIATEDDVPALVDQLSSNNPELELMIAQALAKTGPTGLESLQQHDDADEYPLKQIIAQVKSEVTV